MTYRINSESLLMDFDEVMSNGNSIVSTLIVISGFKIILTVTPVGCTILYFYTIEKL